MLGYGTPEPILVSNGSVKTHNGSIRWLLWCCCGTAIILLLAATFDHVQQRRLRYRAERLLSNMRSVALRQTEAEAQAYLAERVFDRFLQMVADGALLTPTGWKAVEQLSYKSSEFSNEEPIVLMRMAPINANEKLVKDDQVQADAYWSDDVGSIDSSFRYRPPKPNIRVVVTVYRFHLLFTSTHPGINENEYKTQEAAALRQWKMEGPFKRWATLEKTITYLTEKSGQTSDPETVENIKKAIATLKRIETRRGNACAC